MNILVTGATGFVGLKLIQKLSENANFNLAALTRNTDSDLPATVKKFILRDLEDEQSIRFAMKDIDVLIHLAGRAHIMREFYRNPIDEFRRVNTRGTICIAKIASEEGVKRLIFVSSVKAVGDQSVVPLSESMFPNPRDPYGISKLEAEIGIQAIARSSKLEVVIIRPPLIYGAGVKGNFELLVRVIQRGIPLPLSLIFNKRSFISVENIIDFLCLCLNNPAAANEVFFISDNEDISTPELCRKLSIALGKSSRLFPCPKSLLLFLALLCGKGGAIERLVGSLQVDITKSKVLLGWAPRYSLDQSLASLGSTIKNKSRKPVIL